jgi:hypothetical protein
MLRGMQVDPGDVVMVSIFLGLNYQILSWKLASLSNHWKTLRILILIEMYSVFRASRLITATVDYLQLVISWHMKAATMCEFSKQEFIGGLQSLG